MSTPAMTRDDAILLLNDHLGEVVGVTVTVEGDAGDPRSAVSMRGVLKHRAGWVEDEDLGDLVVYYVGEDPDAPHIYIYPWLVLIADEDGFDVGIAFELAPTVTLAVTFDEEEEAR